MGNAPAAARKRSSPLYRLRICGAIPLSLPPQVFKVWNKTRLSYLLQSLPLLDSSNLQRIVWWEVFIYLKRIFFREGGGEVRRLSEPFSWPHYFLHWPNFSGECFKFLLSLQKILSAPYITLSVIRIWLSSVCPANAGTVSLSRPRSCKLCPGFLFIIMADIELWDLNRQLNFVLQSACSKFYRHKAGFSRVHWDLGGLG